jgi:hypothetical protein
MIENTKYPRSFHYDFSPGTTSDDRINKLWRDDVLKFETMLHSEKLDGESTALMENGVFARSHAAPTTHPWADYLKIRHSMMVNDLMENNMAIYGENLYAQHSIIYPKLESHFFVFGIRVLDMWLSWAEVKWYAEFFDLPVVPELFQQNTQNTKLIEEKVVQLSNEESVFGSIEGNGTPIVCTREGIVSRNIEQYHVNDFSSNLFKYVRKGHVTTDVHWTKNVKRAKLIHEY